MKQAREREQCSSFSPKKVQIIIMQEKRREAAPRSSETEISTFFNNRHPAICNTSPYFTVLQHSTVLQHCCGCDRDGEIFISTLFLCIRNLVPYFVTRWHTNLFLSRLQRRSLILKILDTRVFIKLFTFSFGDIIITNRYILIKDGSGSTS